VDFCEFFVLLALSYVKVLLTLAAEESTCGELALPIVVSKY